MGRQIIIIFIMLLSSFVINAQNSKIEEEVKRFLFGSCNEQAYLDLLVADPKLSIQLLKTYKSDTLKCIDRKVYETTGQLFRRSKNKSEIVDYLLDYIADSSNTYSGFFVNCIYEKIHSFDLTLSQVKKLNNHNLVYCNTRNVPLLVSYLEIKEMIPILYEWEEQNELNEYDKIILRVSLSRLGEERMFSEVLNMSKDSDAKWLRYFDYLNFIRSQKSIGELVGYMSNDTEIVLERIPDAYMIIKCKLSALALYHLSMSLEDFPFSIQYMDLYDDLSEKVKSAKQWFEENPNYRINTKLGWFKL